MKKFIDDGYTIITTPTTAELIKNICPNVKTLDILEIDATHKLSKIRNGKFLVDFYFKADKIVKIIEADKRNEIVFYRFTKSGLEKLEMESGYSNNNRGTTLNEMDLVFKMGQLALEVQENECKSYELDTPYYELGNIVKQAYEDMYSAFKGYYHE